MDAKRDKAIELAPESEDGWLVVATIPRLGAIGNDDQIFFAAAMSDSARAKTDVQKALGGLHCTIELRFRMTRKALARLQVPQGQIRRLPSY